MDKNFVIAYELTAETYSKNIDKENIPMKFKNLKECYKTLNTFPKECIFQLMIIGKKQTLTYTV